MKTQKSEKGQALVLIILSIVGLFGFAALAVDGGQLYAERRRAQSAVDAAALAAAYEVENGANDPLWVAEDMVFDNGGYETNGVDTWVEVYNPPIDGPYMLCDYCNNNFDANEYFQVKITRKLNPVFMQILGNSLSMFTVEAVSHARPITSLSPGDAVHALSTDEDALTTKGNVKLTINGGNLRSNGKGVKDGNATASFITVNEAAIYTALGWKNSNKVTPKPKQDDALFVAFPPAPDCNIPAGTSTTTGNGSKASTTLTPGYYASGIKIPNGKIIFEPGMYCIKGDLDVSGGDVTGDGVFFVLLNGGMKVNGNSLVTLKRPNDLLDGAGNQWGGMLIYAPLPNASTLDITGGNNTSYMGTIFAPAGFCDVGGNAEVMGLSAQVVCDKIRFHGTPSIDITYKEQQNYRTPPMVELTQ